MQASPRISAVLLAAAAWFGLALQLFLSIRLAYRSEPPSLAAALVSYFGYFTILANLFIALVASAEVFDIRAPRTSPLAKRSVAGCATASMAFVGISYHLLLRHVWAPQGLQLVADIDLHYAVPLLAVLHWCLHRGPRLPGRSPLLWCVFPAAYFVYALIRGAWLGSYPYPFIDVTTLGYARVGVHALGLLAGVLLIGYLIWGIGNLRAAARA